MKEPTGYTGVGQGHTQGVSQAGREEGLPEEVKFKQREVRSWASTFQAEAKDGSFVLRK